LFFESLFFIIQWTSIENYFWLGCGSIIEWNWSWFGIVFGFWLTLIVLIILLFRLSFPKLQKY
jgi:hypothetical protein